MDSKIIELFDEINSPLRSALAIADLLACSGGHSLLDGTLPDIGTVLIHHIQHAYTSCGELHSLLSEVGAGSSR